MGLVRCGIRGGSGGAWNKFFCVCVWCGIRGGFGVVWNKGWFWCGVE